MQIKTNTKYEILTPYGFKDFFGVSKSSSEYNIKINTTLSTLICTPDHKIYINQYEKTEAKLLNVGDIIQTEYGTDTIISIENYGTTDVYDVVEVDYCNSFYANGIHIANCMLLDEFAFVPNQLAEEFFTSVVPTISSGKDTKLFVVSTPFGLNHFYKLYSDGLKEGTPDWNGFKTMHVTWKDHPKRDQKWADEQRRLLGDLKFSQEYEADFQGSANTLLNSTCIKSLVYKSPIHINSELNVYEAPISEHLYVITVDVARGQGLDYSALKVFDITDSPYHVVASYRSNEIPPILYPNIIHKVAKDYNNSYVLIELNDIGGQVIDILHQDLEYENVLYSTDGLITEWGKMGKAGLRTTQKSKKIGCSALKSLMENSKLIDNDYDTIVELSTFIATKTSYAADDGCNDDLTMCLVLFGYLTTQQFFKDITNVNIRNLIYENQMQRIENELTPYGYKDDGSGIAVDDVVNLPDAVWINGGQDYNSFLKDYWDL